VAVLEGHESEKESYRKTCRLIAAHPDLRGIYGNSLPAFHALDDNERAGRIRLIATDLFPEMAAQFRSGTIRASIYRDPYLQGQAAVRLLTDFLLNRTEMPEAHFLNPGIG